MNPNFKSSFLYHWFQRLNQKTQSQLRPQLKSQSQSQVWQNDQGFTLVELLLAAAIGSIIISSILWLVVQLVNNEKQEFSRSQTDQDMQRALDYIASDLRQAVYVYDGSCNQFDSTSCPSYIKYVPSNLSYSLTSTSLNSVSIPVLAFWKATSLSDTQLPSQSCSAVSQSSYSQDCRTLRQQRTMYSLVIYVQQVDTSSSWSGRSCIARYELPKYQDPASLNRSPGFVDPTEVNGLFPTWPLKASGTNCQVSAATCGLSIYDSNNDVFTSTFSTTTVTETTTNSSPYKFSVLADFVDCPNPSVTGTCPGYTATVPTLSDPPCPTSYFPVPRDYSVTNSYSLAALRSRSFFACVAPNTTTTGTDFSGNTQDIIVYLRGNSGNRKLANGSISATTDLRLNTDTYTALLQTRVSLRGVLNYQPQ
jgi:prepilin-type N-terminal cleavage/methylation domain-containing protein